MADDNEKPPILVNGSPLSDQMASGLRTILLIVSVATALTTLFSKRDLAGFIVYVQSSEFIQAVSIIASVGTFWWGQWKIRHRAKQLAAVGANPRVPDDIISIKPTA